MQEMHRSNGMNIPKMDRLKLTEIRSYKKYSSAEFVTSEIKVVPLNDRSK